MARRFISSSVLAGLLAFGAASAFAADIGSLSQENPDQWRGSKLAGVPIYGPDDKRVGKITDMLMSHDGKAQYVIVGIGGFLGIGEKDVAVPFDQVVFTDEPVKAPPSTMGATTANAAVAPDTTAPAANGMSASTAVAPPAAQAGLGTPATPLANTSGTDVAGAAPARSTTYPDHGRISLTVDQLKNAPAFHFAR